VLIIGGGPAGAAAAVYAARKGIRTGIVAERFGGQTMDTLGIENYISVLEPRARSSPPRWKRMPPLRRGRDERPARGRSWSPAREPGAPVTVTLEQRRRSCRAAR
jgi:alkyl hydroperoxide reductase subunit F